jgi:polyhydroxybutyrate depolymerase
MSSTTARLAALIMIVAALAVAGCSDDPSPSSAATPDTSSSSTTSTTAAQAVCTPAAGYTPGTTTHQLPIADANREFLVHLPPAPTADMALVVDFHGAGSNMNQQAAYSGFDPLADKEGFVVATPNGIDAAVRQWRFLGTPDDVDFAKAVVADLVAHACVDPARAYAVGISSGSAMSTSLACQASDTFAGFGLVAADFYLPPLCDAAEPHPIIIFHGTDDQAVPYNGGPVLGGPTNVQPAEQSAQLWATHNGCTAGPTEATLGTEVVRLDWTGCKEPVVMYRIVGGGHTWPGSIDVGRLGATTHQVNATDEMWKLFDQDQ